MRDPVRDLAARRYSCRDYLAQPLTTVDRDALAAVLDGLNTGPLGNRCRFALLAATQEDRDALKGLGTYGFIKGATGFIVGVVRPGPGDMEDYGYLLERAVLEATDLGLGTCWLGGTFSKSSFARRMGALREEVMPAVIATGYPSENSKSHWVRRSAGSDRRLPPERLFFDHTPEAPLDAGQDDALAALLEVFRWAPSASNKQPWRLVRTQDAWHFYLERTPGYGKGLVKAFIKLADLQRVDIGIAMCHFELAARELGLSGRWVVQPPPPQAGAPGWEYAASWKQ